MKYLFVHDGPQSRLSLDNGIRHPHLPAQRRQKDNQLDGINIIGYQDQRRLLVFNQPHHVVQAILDHKRLLADILLLLPLAHGRRLLMQPFLLLSLGLRAVFVEKLEGLRGGVAVEMVRELRDRGGYFEAEVEDLLLALEADVGGPFDHAGEVAAGLDVLTDAEVAGAFFDEGALRECQYFCAAAMARGSGWSFSKAIF